MSQDQKLLPNRAPVFVVGCPRSGTSLLASVLESRFEFAVPIETHFVPFFSDWLWLWGNLEQPRNRALLLKAIYDFLDLLTPRMVRERDPVKVKAHSLLCTRPRFDEIVEETNSFAEIVKRLFSDFAQTQNKHHWADKSAFSHPVPIEGIVAHFPDAKVIHVVRDARDVVLSWTNSWIAPANLETAARLWARHVRTKRQWGDKNPERYLEIRFEDLLLDTDGQIDRIGAFLNVTPAQGSDRRSDLALMMSEADTHRKLAGELDSSSVGQWRSKLPRADIEAIEALAGAELEALGYNPGPSNRSIGIRGIRSYFGPLFSPIEYVRGSRPLIPPLIRAAQGVGLSLPAITNRGKGFKNWRQP